MVETEILTIGEMAEADRFAASHGTPTLTLMENAGRAVADEIALRWTPRTCVVLCGPGNNGGDGFVVARLLKARGFDVRVALLGARAALKGDAAAMAGRWEGGIEPLAPEALQGALLVVDAMFGAGLSRALEGAAKAVTEALANAAVPIVAVDVPSGLSGDAGRALGDLCIEADLTVTFFRKKPAHVLMPGRMKCGEVFVADIGIPREVFKTVRPRIFENAPLLWSAAYPWPKPSGHKYGRGHCVVVSGPAHATGAARLAAESALRTGAGLVSVASPPAAVAVNAAHLTAVMVKPFEGASGLVKLLEDTRLNTVVIGPGLGANAEAKALVKATGAARRVLDADALTAFRDDPSEFFAQLHAHDVLTPHEGEFERLFPGVLAGAASRIEAARVAAERAGCVVLLKGADTVIAAPDRRAAVNTNAPPWLATAGSGDVLAGIIGGLLAQGMPAFEAACAGAWLHGEAANCFGIGLIAEDLPAMLPRVLQALQTG